jgi:iron complex outermembrane receptor protein
VGLVGFVNYRAGITSTYATPTGTGVYTANAYTTVDLRASVTLPNVGLAKGVQLALEVNNLFDRNPPFFPAGDGTGGAYNPIGRYVALNVRKVF